MENLILSFNCVLPMFLILLTGMMMRRAQIVPESVFDSLSVMTFRFLMPFLMFYNVYSTDLSISFQPDLMAFLVIWILLWFILSYILIRRFEPDPGIQGAYIQTAYRSNLAVIGMTLAQSLLDEAGMATTAIAVSILVPLYNILAVITLESCRGKKVDFRHTVKEILKNPLIVSCAVGLFCLLLKITLPHPVESAVIKLGNSASVMMLIALGASIRLQGVRDNLRQVLFCNVLRLFIAPFFGVTAAILLGFEGDALAIVLICTASPTASASYPMALACGSNHELTGQCVVTTALFCCLTMFLWIFVLKQLAFL